MNSNFTRPGPPNVSDLKENAAVGASQNAALDRLICFVVSTLFDEKSNKRELMISRSMFMPIARVTLIPRDRPMLASIIDIDELFRLREKLFFGTGKWIEAFRLHEEGADDIRVHVNVSTDSNPMSCVLPRSADILFSVKTLSGGKWIIRSCNVVYDEARNARSPVTLIS